MHIYRNGYLSLPPDVHFCTSSALLQSAQIQTRDRNLSLQSEELSLGPLVGGVSKLPSNHIQCGDWRGARPHLELIAADATQHKEMGHQGGRWGGMGVY